MDVFTDQISSREKTIPEENGRPFLAPNANPPQEIASLIKDY